MYANLKDGRTVYIDAVITLGHSCQGVDIKKKELPEAELLHSEISGVVDEICRDMEVKSPSVVIIRISHLTI